MKIEKTLGTMYGVEIVLRTNVTNPRCVHETLSANVMLSEVAIHELSRSKWFKQLLQEDGFIRSYE